MPVRCGHGHGPGPFLSSSGRSPYRFRPWLCERGTGEHAALSWSPPSPRGGIIRSPPPKHASSRRPCRPHRPAPRVRCPIGRHGQGGNPGGAPRGAGEPWLARRGTRLGRHRRTTGSWGCICIHADRLPLLLWPDGVKGALSWLRPVSHIFGRWDGRTRGGAVINACPPRPRLWSVGNFMMVLLTSHKLSFSDPPY